MVYCVNIIRLNHFTIEICGFYCGACHCFYRYTDAFYIVYFLSYTGVWYFMNAFVFTLLCVSESDIIKLFNQSFNLCCLLTESVSKLNVIGQTLSMIKLQTHSIIKLQLSTKSSRRMNTIVLVLTHISDRNDSLSLIVWLQNKMLNRGRGILQQFSIPFGDIIR